MTERLEPDTARSAIDRESAIEVCEQQPATSEKEVAGQTSPATLGPSDGQDQEREATNDFLTALCRRYQDPEFLDRLRKIENLELHELRIVWRKEMRKEPPKHLSRWLLQRTLCYRMQEKRFGPLDPKVARYLDLVTRNWLKRTAKGAERNPKAVPTVPPYSSSKRLPLGTVLIREHNDVIHRVMVVRDGYAWGDQVFASLSAAAYAISGTRWNGPLFFGLTTRDNSKSCDADDPCDDGATNAEGPLSADVVEPKDGARP